MKTKIFAFSLMLITLITMVVASCNTIKESETSNTLTPSVSITNCTESQRPMMRLTVMPNESPYDVLRPIIVDYVIDNNPELRMQRFFGGSDAPLNEKQWDANLDNNFISGSILNFTLWESHIPTVRYLLPQLPAGSHEIILNLKDSDENFGAYATISQSWIVE